MKGFRGQLQGIDPFDARSGGLRRFSPPGCDIYVGRLHAGADIWISPDQQLLVRFSHAGLKRHFRVILPREANPAQLSPTVLCDYLADQLYGWLNENSDF